jgi:hypothetical protein
MSKLARTLTMAAMVAAMQLAGMTAVAHAHSSTDPASARHRALGREELLATADHAVAAQQQPTDDAVVRRLLARERASIPNGAPGHTAADAAHPRLLLDEDRSTLLNLPNPAPTQPTSPVQPAATPSGQTGRRIPALGVLAAVLALAAGVTVVATRRAGRSHRASQTA